ncbi:MAG: DNA polymerase/3'-5' exonuclease PolX [Candidatus Lokiarchaeota archaeon]|nr:DNA polymerase/3'-5' exonuclease PolX [Candidatus Lokiarchaeota archaeon]
MVTGMGGVCVSKNQEVAEMLKEIGLLLEIKGANKWKIRAYKRATRAITSHGEDVQSVDARGELTEIPGIGDAIAEKISSYLDSGVVPELEKLRAEIPVAVMQLEAIPGVGPKTIKLVYDELGVNDLDSMEEAARTGRIAELKGMGTKTEQQILDGIALVRSGLGRTLLADALPYAEQLIDYLKKLPEVSEIALAGSIRRKRETVHDVDILVSADDAEMVMNAFVEFEYVQEVIAHGTTKSSVRLDNALQIDLRIIPAESFGAGLQYFTGSVDHNVRVRSIAQSKNMLLNEYGLFQNEVKVAGDDERAVYGELGLPFIPPELREDKGEIEAAQENHLPNLITLEDVRGDLHSHTDQSDGSNTIHEMLEAADEIGYDYYCVSDHTQSLAIANGMDEGRLLKRIDEVDEINDSGRYGLTVLKGAEVDILEGGLLDIRDDVLEQLDVVTVSIHSRMKDDKETMTQRVCKALENKHVHMLGHPTGRLLLKRSGYEIDLDAVLEVARQNNVAMELNALPRRLDLNPGNLRAAKRIGVKIAINTDAHKIAHLNNMKYGVFQARRGWIEPDDVLNTFTLEELRQTLK